MPDAICALCGNQTVMIAGGNRYCMNYYCESNDKPEVTPLEDFTYYDA